MDVEYEGVGGYEGGYKGGYEVGYEGVLVSDPLWDGLLYYALLLPATFPVTVFFLLLAWMGRKFFTHN